MKAYQCSRCENLQDYDDYCNCSLEIDIRPNHREKGSTKLCKENFKPLKEEKQWHEKFSWE